MKMRWVIRRVGTSEPEVVVYDTETHEVTAAEDIATMIDLFDNPDTIVPTWFALNFAIADLENPPAAWGVINSALEFIELNDKSIEIVVTPPPLANPNYSDTDLV